MGGSPLGHPGSACPCSVPSWPAGWDGLGVMATWGEALSWESGGLVPVCPHLAIPALRGNRPPGTLILRTAQGEGGVYSEGRLSPAQRRRGEGRVRQADCSPQFLSSRPLGQSLTPSQAGTQSPFTEQRNSPGHAAGERGSH